MLELRKTRFGQKRSIHERKRRRRTATRVVVVVVILVFLLLIAGVMYAWYMGRNPEQRVVQTVPASTQRTTINPYEPAADAAVSIVLQSLTTPVKPGNNVAMTIKTNPKAACQIIVKANGSALPDTGLIPKVADEYGVVGWSWTVPGTVPAAKWPIEVTCANTAKKSAYYKAELEIVL